MEFDNLLSEDDHYRYLILKYLELKKDSYINIGAICEVMGLSHFKTKGYLQGIQTDLIELGSTSEIKSLENGEISVENLDFLIVKKMRLLYLNRSEKFILFQSVLFDEISIEKYKKENFLSKTKAYEIKKSLTNILKEQKVIYKINKLEGNELSVRKYICSIYYEFYNGLATDFSKTTNEQVNQLIMLLTHHFRISLPYTKFVKLKIFLTVQVLRSNQGHVVGNLETIVDQSRFSTQETEAFNGFVHIMKKKELLNEWHYLLLFLYCENIIELEMLPFDFSNFSKVMVIAKESAEQIVRTMKLSDGVEEAELELIKQFQRIHLKLQTFYTSFETFSLVSQFTYFEESYPVLSTCLLKRVAELLQQKEIEPSMQARLYYDYIFAVLKVIKLEVIESKIYVCVDFSHGDNYTHYISEQIKGFKNLNIELQKRITSNTDLYVSDFAIDQKNCAQIIWKNPPTANDWEDFGNTIIMIKNKVEE